MYRDLEHPEITWIEETGYPSWMQGEEEQEEFDEDAAFEASREERMQNE